MTDKDSQINAHLLTFALYREQRNWPEALRVLQSGLKLDPSNIDLHLLLGSTFAEMERWGDALQEYRVAQRLDPDNAGVHFPLATAYFNENLLDEAIAEFEIGLSKDPSEYEPHFFLARCYHKQGRLDEAFREYEAALRINPNQVICHYGMGDVRKEQGRLDEAIREFQSGLYLEPNIPEFHRTLSECYEQQGYRALSQRELQIANKLESQAREETVAALTRFRDRFVVSELDLSPSGRVEAMSYVVPISEVLSSYVKLLEKFNNHHMIFRQDPSVLHHGTWKAIAQLKVLSLLRISDGILDKEEENYDGRAPLKNESSIPTIMPSGCQELWFEMMKIQQYTAALYKSYIDFTETDDRSALEKAGEAINEIPNHIERASTVAQAILEKITA